MVKQRRMKRLLLLLLAITIFIVLSIPVSASETTLQISPSFLQIRSYVPQAIDKTTPIPVSQAVVTTVKAPKIPSQAKVQSLEIPRNEDFAWKLSIPVIGLSAPIEEVGYTTVGKAQTWAVPNNTVGTPQDAITNNLVLIGHTGAFTSVFNNVYLLQVGDTFTVTKEFNATTYKITEHVTVDVHDLSYIISPKTPRVTIITCVPQDTSKRRIIVAEKI